MPAVAYKPALVLRTSAEESGKVVFLNGRNSRKEEDAVLRAGLQLSRLKRGWPSYALAVPSDKAAVMISSGQAELQL